MLNNQNLSAAQKLMSAKSFQFFDVVNTLPVNQAVNNSLTIINFISPADMYTMINYVSIGFANYSPDLFYAFFYPNSDINTSDENFDVRINNHSIFATIPNVQVDAKGQPLGFPSNKLSFFERDNMFIDIQSPSQNITAIYQQNGSNPQNLAEYQTANSVQNVYARISGYFYI